MLSSKKSQNMAAGIAIIVLMVVAAWFLLLSPRLGEAGDISAQADTVVQANAQQEIELGRLEQQKKDAPAAAERVTVLFSKMPQQANLPEVFAQINAAAASAGINPNAITSLTPSVPVPVGQAGNTDGASLPGSSGANLAEINITMSVNASLAAMQRFVANLEAMDRALLLTTVSISGGEGGEYTVSLTGKMFLLQSELPDLVKQVNDLIAQSENGGQPSGGATPSPAPSESAPAAPSTPEVAPSGTPSPTTPTETATPPAS
jgi:Tfp pilus assembly protein PilO